MKNTERLRLNLPEGIEYYDVELFNENARILEAALCNPATIPAPCTVFYAAVSRAPTQVAEIEAMARSDYATVTIPAGWYCISCARRIVRIRDQNMLDNTASFAESRVGTYYVYTYANSAVIPMEFTVYF